MMKKRFIIYSFSMALLLGACDKPDQIGPDIVGLYGPVTVTEAFDKSDANPDFSAGQKVNFIAKFENDAAWTITIVGNNTGAVKTISGVSKEINALNSTWDGSANNPPSFGVEPVTATLSFASTTDTYTTNLTIAGTRNADAGGVLVTNFAVSKVGDNNHGGTTVWNSDWPASTIQTGPFVQPDGNAYLQMGGTPWQGAGSPYIDYLTIRPATSDVNYGTYFPLYADPAKVYFNLMVYNTGTADTWLRVFIMEEGVTARIIDIRPEWTGWKLLSYNYSQLTAADGAGAPQPNKITGIQFVLLSDAATLPGPAVSAAFDHIIFTHNKPWQP